MESPQVLHIAPDQESSVVVRRMLAVAGNVWCAAHRFVYVLNSVTLKVEVRVHFQTDLPGSTFPFFANRLIILF